MADHPHIVVFGAGSIGCWVGGRLAASGAKVTLIGRQSMAEALADGLVTTDHANGAQRVPADRFRFAIEPAVLAEADLVLLCLKGPDTEAAAHEIAARTRDDVPVVSLQNGIGPAETLAAVLGRKRTVPAAVVFNVVRTAPDSFHRATDGPIVLPEGAVLDGYGLPIQRTPNIEGARWSKLMLNLVNGPNVLSGLPLREHLLDRDWRRVFARSIREGMAVAQAGGIRIERVGRVHPALAARVLPLPNWLFTRVARQMMRVDPTARTSMVDDLEAGRRPEIETLNGAIVARGEALGVATPMNRAVADAVRDAFAKGRSPGLSGRSFLDAL